MAIVTYDRLRSQKHRRYVATQRCCVCFDPPPSDPHHLKFAQPRAMSMKVSDAYCVPLCRRCHDMVEICGDEEGWWRVMEIDALRIASDLWMGEIPF